jgi:chemotaxis signal transduction protein
MGLVYHAAVNVASPPGERKAILFTAGGVRLALRLSQVREIVAIPEDVGEVLLRGVSIPALPVAVALGLTGRATPFAIVTEADPPLALRVEALHGIVDLEAAEVFQLPAQTLLPQPSPFLGALVVGGDVALELAVSALGWAPRAPAAELPGPPPELDFASGRELLFSRAGRVYAVPLQILAQVLEAPRVFEVPLAPAAHRGVLYHGRAIHPVFDVAVLYGDVGGAAGMALLLDAGGNALAVLADRVLHAGESVPEAVARPSWDLLFSGV